MLRTIKTKYREIDIECNAASPIIYKRIWGGNLMTEIQTLSVDEPMEALETIQKAIYVFHLTAEKGTKEALNANDEGYIDFILQFEMLELADPDVISQVFEAWGYNIKSESEPKNQQSPQSDNPQ